MKEMKWYESQSEQGISFKLLKRYLERRIKSLSFRSLLVVKVTNAYIYIYNRIVQRRRSFSYIRVFMKLFLHLEKVKDI